ASYRAATGGRNAGCTPGPREPAPAGNRRAWGPDRKGAITDIIKYHKRYITCERSPLTISRRPAQLPIGQDPLHEPVRQVRRYPSELCHLILGHEPVLLAGVVE